VAHWLVTAHARKQAPVAGSQRYDPQSSVPDGPIDARRSSEHRARPVLRTQFLEMHSKPSAQSLESSQSSRQAPPLQA
jgi:hypothetical protein